MRAASARSSGSARVASKAARISAARSSAMPGGAKNGRPILLGAAQSDQICRCSSVCARSNTDGADFALAQPVGVERDQRVPTDAAAAIDLAALHRDVGLG